CAGRPVRSGLGAWAASAVSARPIRPLGVFAPSRAGLPLPGCRPGCAERRLLLGGRGSCVRGGSAPGPAPRGSPGCFLPRSGVEGRVPRVRPTAPRSTGARPPAGGGAGTQRYCEGGRPHWGGGCSESSGSTFGHVVTAERVWNSWSAAHGTAESMARQNGSCLDFHHTASQDTTERPKRYAGIMTNTFVGTVHQGCGLPGAAQIGRASCRERVRRTAV